jgi:hypothetical protein
MLGCLGAGHSSQLAEISSKEFEHEDKNGVQSVQSGVTVDSTAALAIKELAEVRRRLHPARVILSLGVLSLASTTPLALTCLLDRYLRRR